MLYFNHKVVLMWASYSHDGTFNKYNQLDEGMYSQSYSTFTCNKGPFGNLT